MSDSAGPIEDELQRDEQAAEAASHQSSAPWVTTRQESDYEPYDWGVFDSKGIYAIPTCYSCEHSGVHEHVAKHAARHDPARVLRQVAAMRQIAEEHRTEDGCCRTCTTESELEARWDGEQEETSWVRKPVVAPCSTMRALASIYTETSTDREARDGSTQ